MEIFKNYKSVNYNSFVKGPKLLRNLQPILVTKIDKEKILNNKEFCDKFEIEDIKENNKIYYRPGENILARLDTSNSKKENYKLLNNTLEENLYCIYVNIKFILHYIDNIETFAI